MESKRFPLHLQAFRNRQLPGTKFLLSSFLKVFFLYLPACNIVCCCSFSLKAAPDMNIMPETIPPLFQPNSFLCISGWGLRDVQNRIQMFRPIQRQKSFVFLKWKLLSWQSLRNMKLVTVLAKTIEICKTNLRSHAPRSSGELQAEVVSR